MNGRKLAYYPGCPSAGTAVDQDMSTRAVFDALGIELAEVEDWNCCGAAEAEDPMLVYALNARTLAIAEKEGLDIVTPCSICYYNLERSNIALKEDESLRAKMRAIDASLDYKGGIKARHILDVFVNEIGIDELKSKIVKKVNVKVAPYYGCYIGRPPATAFDDPDDPILMDQLIELIGGECVDFSYMKSKCCGGPLMMTRPDIAFEMAKNVLEAAKRAGADCIALACPLCGMMLDAKQPDIEKALNIEIGMPVIYITQLLGLALGIDSKRLGLDKAAVDTKEIVGKVV
ncbi:MAG: CoB--CoM heterodisulfide reductase iron-sulfur subunit B family protein [Methanophagales archaeon]|nr:CoB--CoM heterodisulfide reductase iron-sulfur subunit B family protein [Methanophagales archaeon]